MRQPDVDPHGLSDAPERRRRRRLPYVVVGVALAALVLFVWLHDRQTAHWENAQYGISLEFENRFRNMGGDSLGIPPDGTVFRNGFVVRGNPNYDASEMHFNGFIVHVIEAPSALRGLSADALAEALAADWRPAEVAVADVPPEATTVGGRPAARYALDLEIGGVVWRQQTWLVPVGDLWYTVLLQARVSDWDTEAEALTEAAQSLRIAEGAGD